MASRSDSTAARRCVRCGAEVHPVAEIDGDDHHVLVETPMEMTHEPQGDVWKITVSQKAGLVSCKTLTDTYPEWWNAGVPTHESSMDTNLPPAREG